MAFNDWIAVRQGAREGARQAVTGRIGSNTACTIRAGSPSFPANSQVNELVCLAKSRVSLNQNRVAVNVKIEDDYNSKESLVVCVMYQLDSITGFYDLVLDNRVVRTSVQMKTEQTVNDATGNGKVLADWAETPLSGTDWSYCSVAQTVT